MICGDWGTEHALSFLRGRLDLLCAEDRTLLVLLTAAEMPIGEAAELLQQAPRILRQRTHRLLASLALELNAQGIAVDELRLRSWLARAILEGEDPPASLGRNLERALGLGLPSAWPHLN